MEKRDRIRIGIVGAGFLADTRARCYAKSGRDCEIVAVADTLAERAEGYAARYGIANHFTDHRALLDMSNVDMVDLCVPNHLHRPMTEDAAEAGKHIVCTKPLTAYVGQDLGPDATDEQISGTDRRDMLAMVFEDARAMVEAAERGGVKLMYGENWIFSPSIVKAVALVLQSGGTIVEMRGGECHTGSHTPFSKIWRYTGGGALIRLGAHPVGTMLYLKRKEGMARDGRPILPVAVSAEVGDLSRIESLQKEKEEWIARGWKDVENWGSALLTFDDGSRGIAWASDTMVGGMESHFEIFQSNSHIKCNLSPNNLVQAYAPGPDVFGEEYIMEKSSTSAGWSTPMPDEDWTSGHQAMCDEFVRTVADDEAPESDGHLGLDVVKVIYSAYVSAAEGRRVKMG